MWDSLVTPPVEVAARWRALGWWRDSTFLDDLRRWSHERPDHPAVIGWEQGRPEVTLTYRQLAGTVSRFAAALAELGVGPRDVVVAYLPNRWPLGPLYLAAMRIGAVIAPVIPALGTRELAYVMSASRAKACVTVDRFNDVDYDERLVTAAASRPEPVHRIVIGDAGRTGAVDFDAFFVRTPWERRDRPDPWPAGAPDAPALLMFTSGTTGQMKGVVHSQNTLYAAARAVTEPLALGAGEVVSIPNFLTHMAGTTYGVLMPLLLGGTGVVQDRNTDMALLLDLVERHGVTFVYAAPSYVAGLVAARRERPRTGTALRHLVTGSAPVDPRLVADVADVFGLPVRSLWGMTENGAVTVTRPDDPVDWAASSDGRPVPWMEVRVVPHDASGTGPLHVRGASQCLGYLGQRDGYVDCLDADGWFDTGDLARDDGRGGIRITGRRTDLITRASGQKVSTLEVEALLQRHPYVVEAVLVGYPDPGRPGGDLVCAVVIPGADVPTLADLHALLADAGVARVLWPDRLQFVRVLPKNSLGKVLRQPLRQRLELAVAPGS